MASFNLNELEREPDATKISLCIQKTKNHYGLSMSADSKVFMSNFRVRRSTASGQILVFDGLDVPMQEAEQLQSNPTDQMASCLASKKSCYMEES